MKQIHGGDIYRNQNMIDFSANMNPCGMPVSVREAAIKGIEQAENYPDCFCEELREAIGFREKVKKEQILCTNGAAEFFYAVCQAIRPQKALLAVPSFAEYELALKSVDCKIQYYNLRQETEFLLEQDYLENLTKELDIIFLCNPNNPVGNLMDKELLEKIIEKCEAEQIICIIDECFLEFCREYEENTLVNKIETFPQLVIVKAFTKMYAMPGLRLGYAISHNIALLEKIRSCIQAWNVSIPSQRAGIAAARETEFVAKTVSLIEEERNYLKTELEKGLAKKVYSGTANFLFFEAETGLYEKIKEQGVLIRDCSNYTGLESGFYRIAVRGRAENDKFLEALRKIENHTGG